jgi:hypothetical protein
MPHLATYVGLLHKGEQTLADAFRTVGEGHAAEADVFYACQTLAAVSDEHVRRLAPIAQRYGEEGAGDDVEEPERLHAEGVGQTRAGAVGLLRDLQDLHLLATLVQTSWTAVAQAAQGARDRDLLEVATSSSADTARQLKWLITQLKVTAPQALLVSE